MIQARGKQNKNTLKVNGWLYFVSTIEAGVSNYKTKNEVGDCTGG